MFEPEGSASGATGLGEAALRLGWAEARRRGGEAGEGARGRGGEGARGRGGEAGEGARGRGGEAARLLRRASEASEVCAERES